MLRHTGHNNDDLRPCQRDLDRQFVPLGSMKIDLAKNSSGKLFIYKNIRITRENKTNMITKAKSTSTVLQSLEKQTCCYVGGRTT